MDGCIALYTDSQFTFHLERDVTLQDRCHFFEIGDVVSFTRAVKEALAAGARRAICATYVLHRAS